MKCQGLDTMEHKQKKAMGTLYIVATPIGNLEDITFRAVRVLKEVDLIAAEDTRHTRKLLSAFGIQTPLTSLFDRNERGKSGMIVSRLREGQDVAYVSDAGTPGISDPGYVLINAAIDAGVTIVPVPGVSAVVTALCVSGLPMDSFVFYAFLPHAGGKKRNLIESLRSEKRTMIFYDSPKRIMETLEIVKEAMGNERRIVVARELTKIHEEIIRGSVADAIQSLENREIKGEITLLVSGAEEDNVISEDDIRMRYDELHKDRTLTTKDIINIITDETGVSRKEVYKVIIQQVRGKGL